MNLRTLRLVLWALVALAVAGAAFLYLRRPSQPVASGPAITLGAPFTLTGTDGKPFSSEALQGRPHVIFFGFTHCPDVCPTTLARLAKLRRDLGKGDDAFDIVLVSVDPERDTPAELARYVTLFRTPVIALTGTPADVAKVTKAFGIFAEKVPDTAGGYTVDHSTQTLLFNRDGSFGGTITMEEADAPALQTLGTIVAS